MPLWEESQVYVGTLLFVLQIIKEIIPLRSEATAAVFPLQNKVLA